MAAAHAAVENANMPVFLSVWTVFDRGVRFLGPGARRLVCPMHKPAAEPCYF